MTWGRMIKVFEGSLIYRVIIAALSWVGQQWRESRILSRFLSPGNGELLSENSVFTKLWLRFHRRLIIVFDKLKLNKLLNNSVFTMPFLWSFITLALAPILPTMVVLGITLVCIGSLLLAFCCDPQKKLVYSPANKPILLFALIYIVATLTSITFSGSLLGGALTTLFVLFTIVVQNSVSTKRQLHALVYAFVVSGAAVSVYGLYQFMFGAFVASGWVDSTMFSEIGVRVFSTLGNPNVLSEYLLLVIPFAGASILIAKRGIVKLFFTGCLGIMLVCMLLTFARGGWLGLVIAAALFLVILDRRFIIVGIVGLLLLYFLLPDVILTRFMSIGNTSDSSTNFRVSIWLGTIAMLRDHWFAGIGPGVAAFNKVYPLYSFNTVYAPHSHNLYLQVICDAGVIGIVVFLAVLFNYFRNLCSAVARASENTSKILQTAAISSVLGFLIQGVTDHSFYNYRVTLVFWAVLGLGALASRSSQLETDESRGIGTLFSGVSKGG